MKEELKKFCKSIDVEYVGICDVGPYYDLEEILNDRVQKGHITGMEESDIKKRIDPRLTMEEGKSIIVCLFPYYIGDFEDSNISKYTMGLDYHIVVKNKLNEMGDFLKENIDGFEYMPFVDTGALVDRYLAVKSGIAYWGINGNVINDKYGSYFFVGYMITNQEFEYDEPMNKTCLQCMNCVKSCPGNVILGDFQLKPERCRSYITQKKGELNEEDISIMKKDKLIFGCDICQEVCPHNKNIEITPIKEFKENIITELNEEEIESISNKEFKRRYYDRAFSWRGKKIIQRNFEVLK